MAEAFALPFFQIALVASLVLAGIHAYLGFHIVRRGVLFVDLALAQMAALGVALGVLLQVEHDEARSYLLALGMTFVGAALFGRVDLLVLGLVLLLLPLAAAIAVTVDRPWISVTRQFESDVVTAGEQAHVSVTLRNEANRRAPSLRWRDACPPELTASGLAPLPALGEHAIASRDRSVTIRWLAWEERPMPPPMTMPSWIAT